MSVKRTETNEAGAVEIKFRFQPAQRRLLRKVQRGGGSYVELAAPQCLQIGGQRSGKTTGALMHGVIDYCLKFNHCDILVLRRTIPELDAGPIQDFKKFVPAALYDFNQSTRVATFRGNGSRVVFAGCANNVERDIEKYLGQAYPYILVDECAQFSPDVWERLYARNLVNAACEHDEHGNLPIPSIQGCTNPIGAHWEYYKTVFIDKEPFEKEDGLRKAKDGSWWVPAADEYRCVYTPAHYAFNHTTVLDNPEYLKRDPGIIVRLKALPKAKMQKFLLGLIDKVEGQYFDCWSEEQHVIDLREDPEAIVWQTWQPVWGGQDWGVGHANAFYLFTKALVKSGVNGELKMKTVCFAEVAPETVGHDSNTFADMINAKVYYPRLPQDHPQYSTISGKRCKVAAIYFSHEKFSRVMEAHSPADEYSRVLRERGLPPVSRGTMDRIGSAGYMYNELKLGRLVILRTCPAIIQSIPALQRDPKRLDDVLKSTAKADDRYDAFRLGLYGAFKAHATPDHVKDEIEASKIEDKFARYFYLKRKAADAKKSKESFVQQNVPIWTTKL